MLRVVQFIITLTKNMNGGGAKKKGKKKGKNGGGGGAPSFMDCANCGTSEDTKAYDRARWCTSGKKDENDDVRRIERELEAGKGAGGEYGHTHDDRR